MACSLPTVTDCGDPTSTANGFINVYSSTIEGAQVTFQCNTDSTVMTASCFSNGSWVPSPADLVCGSTPSQGNVLFTSYQYTLQRKLRVPYKHLTCMHMVHIFH